MKELDFEKTEEITGGFGYSPYGGEEGSETGGGSTGGGYTGGNYEDHEG
ncbi:hypothetical protein [Teredinibacter sp. KSP-S5-2]|nr:hypothetical protein [Teredinibacter sp. KSP-S5-2]WNO07797.1 hypothetical protein P5V12_12435 [Teredinibacter sp. KSP-S5-2]